MEENRGKRGWRRRARWESLWKTKKESESEGKPVWMGLRYRSFRGWETDLERREEAARPVETRVLPREVLEAQMRNVGCERGRSRDERVVERCLRWRMRWL